MPNSTLQWIPTGYQGTSETIAAMKALVDSAKKHPDIISLARRIVFNVEPRDHMGEARAVFEWLRTSVRFANDPYGVETLTAPWILINDPAPTGDCDCLSTLYNSLMSALGYNTAFKTIKAEAGSGEFTHVYSLVEIDGRWVAADCSQPYELGWEPPIHYGAEIWGYARGDITRRQVNGLEGLGMTTDTELKALIIQWLMLTFGVSQADAAQTVAAASPEEIQAAAETATNAIQAATDVAISSPEALPLSVDLAELDLGETFYDQDHYTYYNDYDGQGAGRYAYQTVEPVGVLGPEINYMLRLRQFNSRGFEQQSMDEKFSGRQRFSPRSGGAFSAKYGVPTEAAVREFNGTAE
jgi:hypothetical protein